MNTPSISQSRWRDSLTVQSAALMVACLIVAHWVAVWAFCDERAEMLRIVATDSLARELSLLADAGPEAVFPAREGVHVWTTADQITNLSEAPLAAVSLFEESQSSSFLAARAETPSSVLNWQIGPMGVSVAEISYGSAILSLPAAEGRWLHATIAMPSWTDPWAQQNWSALLFTSFALILAAIAISYRVIRPLRALAGAAESFAGAQAEPVAVQGPGEVGRTLSAFNTMQERISSLIGERTRMLSALGHDLRTPMTRLRLRAHLIEDTDLRDPVLRDLDEMEGLAESALDLARGAGSEPMQETDLQALLRALADDLNDAGIQVALKDVQLVLKPVQREGLRRAAANLLENAHRYAGGGTLSLRREDDAVRIIVSDNGPGIPEDRLGDVTKPFVRLETSRARHTGGSGLGLALALATAEAHSGMLTLQNRPDGGLEATITLPLQS
ncbi:MAG: ATP-binding protein [Pseudomonadota bacterium]